MNQHFDVLIIGAGLSGIGTACHVTAEFPDKTIALLERRERLGGTWDLFRYPGVRSDSDMFTFGYKFRPWRDVKVLADGASIRQYIADTATEFGVDEKKSDIAGAYLCRLLRHMADNGYTVATPRDAQDCALDVGMFDQLNSGYVKRGQDIMPRQGSKHPWRVLMHYEKDAKILLEDPIDDGVLHFAAAAQDHAAA